MTTQQAIIWIATGVILVAGVVILISRGVKSGKKLPTPTTTQYDTQDAPPSDSTKPEA